MHTSRFSRKLAFVVVQAQSELQCDDGTGPELQLVLSHGSVGDEAKWERAVLIVELVGDGDVLLCRGWPGRTRTGKHGDISIFVHTLEVVRLSGTKASTLRLLRQLEQRRW